MLFYNAEISHVLSAFSYILNFCNAEVFQVFYAVHLHILDTNIVTGGMKMLYHCNLHALDTNLGCKRMFEVDLLAFSTKLNCHSFVFL